MGWYSLDVVVFFFCFYPADVEAIYTQQPGRTRDVV